jgi:hypothetical protein
MAKVNLQMIASGAIDLKKILEWDFQVALGKYAESRGWKVHYTKQTGYTGSDGRWRSMAPSGWPDMTMVRDGDMVIAELKRDVGGKAGEPTEAQQEWLDVLDKVPGVSTFLWRPRDAAEVIERLK